MTYKSIIASTLVALALSSAPVWSQATQEKPAAETSESAEAKAKKLKKEKQKADEAEAAAEKVVEQPKAEPESDASKKTAEEAPKAEAEPKKEAEAPATEKKKKAEKEAAPKKEQDTAKEAESAPKVEETAKEAESQPKAEEAVKQQEPKAEESAEQPKEPENTEAAAKSEKPKAEEVTSEEADKSPDAKEKRKKPKATAEAETSEPVADPAVEAPAIVKDDQSDAEKARLAEAERQRRKDKRKRRNELIGAAAAGVAVGVLVNELGGKVVGDEGDRIIVERDGEIFVRKDENERLRDNGARVRDEILPNGNMRTTVERPNGVQVVTLRDTGGFILRRTKQLQNGDIIVLVDNRNVVREEYVDYGSTLPPIRIGIPEDRYIVDTGRADRRIIRETLRAKPVEETEQTYTLREVRDNERLRAKVRRIDLDTITFDTGSYSLTRSQVDQLADIGGSMQSIIDENPREVFLIEGHTDAVGDGVSNLTLSDRRAETIARVLTQRFGVPPENMVVQGYGEQYLKVNSAGAERANRRVSVRRITPLLNRS